MYVTEPLSLIPENTSGKPTDLESNTTLSSLEEAATSYIRACKRLMNPAIWHELAGWASAHFELVGGRGEDIRRLTKEGDHFRIDLPGPGSAAGHGFDWVVVEKIREGSNSETESEWTYLEARPCTDPRDPTGETAHFFMSEASSSYIVERSGARVSASYHGRNEKPNTHTSGALDNIRNAIVAGGAALGLSEIQWSSLLKGLLSPEIGG